MVPTPLILAGLLIAFFPSTFAYLFGWPKRRIANPYFAVLGTIAALMLFTIILAIFDVQVVWLSWVLLAIAILMFERSITMLRRARASMRAHERRIVEHRARGG
jgi:hypothetical protein